MAHELRPHRQLARHRGALLVGQKPRRLVALAVNGRPGRPAGVAPVTRNAGLLRLRDGGRGIPRAGYRDFSFRSPVPRRGRCAR